MLEFLIDTLAYYTGLFFFFGIFLSVFFACAVSLLWKWFHILRTPTTPIADLKAGEVEIKGRVRAIETIPNLDRSAVYYKAIRERYQSGKEGGWKHQSSRETLLPFEVEDGSGKITIDHEGASVEIAQDKITGRNVQSDGAERTRHFYLGEGSPVYVIGHLHQYRGEQRIGKKSGVPFIISDYKESTLLSRYGGCGFGLMAGVILATLALLSRARSRVF